jgi:hypothetical protein
MSNGLHVILGEEPPMPPKSDIEIKIDFDESDGSAARVFDIASNIIRAFEDLDRVLVTSVDSKIRTSLILEDVEKSSLKIWLRNILRASDDQAIKELDWKPQVGKYLVRAKYAALQWLDQSIGDDPPKIEDLTQKMRELAAETDVRHIPDYAPINPARLAQPLDAIQRTKGQFKEGEKLTITLGKEDYQVNLERRWLPSEHLPDIPIERELSNELDMVLIIRKPDFLAKSQWQFKHGKTALFSAIEDEDWMHEFHAGRQVIKPGDALRVRVRIEYSYNADGDLCDQKTTIIKVYGIIPSSAPLKGMFDDDE